MAIPCRSPSSKSSRARQAEPGEFIDFGTLAAISALIVQCAQLAFDLKRSKNGGGEKLRSSSPEGDSANKSDKERLRHELRLELGLPEGVSEKTRDVVIDAVAEETEAGE